MKFIGYREGRRAVQEDKNIKKRNSPIEEPHKFLPEMNELILLETDRLT